MLETVDSPRYCENVFNNNNHHPGEVSLLDYSLLADSDMTKA
jgi:glutaminase